MSNTKIEFTAQELEAIEEIKRHSYLDPRFDAAFKAFLNEDEALTSFLNGVLRLENSKRIVKVNVKNTEVNILFPEVKAFRFDIRATTAEGRAVNIEMQKVMPSHFVDRILLQHSAFLLQAKYELDKDYMSRFPVEPTEEQRAERLARRYKIPPTYAIWICDFKVPHQREYHDVWRVTNGEGLTVTDKIKYILIDLTQFSASENELDSDEKRWLYLLKHAGVQESLPDFEDEVFSRALRRICVGKADAQLLKDQANNMMTDDEKLDFIAYHKVKARKEGLAEGLAEGRAEGRAEGLAEGRSEGLAEGRAEGRSEGRAEGRSEGLADVARRMLSKGMSVRDISELTGLAEDQILAMKA